MPVVKKLQKHKLIFDTHVFFWFMLADLTLSKKFRKEVDQLVQHSAILISPISIWELGLLVQKGRITLEMDCLDWVEQALTYPGVQLAPFSPQVAVLSSRLPGNIH